MSMWSSRLRSELIRRADAYAHPRRRAALPAPHNATAGELDSCTSSDALLMNCFCFPGMIDGAIARLLHVRPGSVPQFGVDGRGLLVRGGIDSTEIDMCVGPTQVEAKLTESDFTRRPKAHVERYAALYDVFERELLPTIDGEYLSYQLIRNVLAIAQRPELRFTVLIDARRPDLVRD